MIGIIDYGLGNIRAFVNIYRQLGIPHRLISKPEEVGKATHLILPGVGAFDFAMEALERRRLVDKLHHAVCVDRMPILGVCVGMQLMAVSSEEGNTAGLGWFDAQVKRIATSSQYPAPHMGWNSVRQLNPSNLFTGIQQGSEFYFLHSYGFDVDHICVIATTSYADDIGVIIQRDNIVGIQCHPEKSHTSGVTFLENFARHF